ncbi:MAG: hypothetical protein ACI9LO_000591 [Planctomycetota bacterium]|jgi:hypothetical protein
MKHPCPHCDEECLSTWQKLFIGSASSKPCKSCGKDVTLPGKYTFLMITVLFLILIVLQVLEVGPVYVLLFGSITAMIFALMQIYRVPLSKSKIDQR